MKTFAVYMPADKHFAKFEFVKEGFSWFGLFFNFMWMLCNRLYKVSIGLVIIFAIINVVGYVIFPQEEKEFMRAIFTLVLEVATCIFCGFNFDTWKQNALLKKRFKFIKTIRAADVDHAKEIFFEGCEINKNF